ncbi:Early light-induced protein 2 [Hibiscus syriacus]|uniref:Early light-induced protein 2 n=1 Tax=Hibiscus syriacus TaxID=106335 RepID=A0A6A3CLS3_HIBSY|nr:early light-induced protein 1, chloroplastic-like [Hibiscus syriacus]XP_039055941.1 early light-induced protein 1, chloroplastic-like [Hibiscus syriacus]KAE8728168.1 Early light-induced protein 2 [Hibiscus syriacus]KAE8728169.1 Early light-induced protein 2 [Hibiscus syriacus]
MAASSVMQMQSLFLASSMTGLANRSRMIPLHNVKPTPRFHRNANVQVRCLAEEDERKVQTPEQKRNPSPASKASIKFSDVFAFSGPAPERINGRLAMVGFVAALAVELSKGEDLFTQISDGGVPLFVGTSILFSLASLVPLFQGVTAESKSGDIMSSDAELLNGRLAMLGLVALALTEYVKGGTLV